ncbi:MAG: phenylalanine--tRNA ligase subunit beta [Spirochaetaceae bacterium]|nr:MAG: phenylalanine--tRNA ligase subunit beta [Spirochaetaceae bacterium]
MPKIELSQQAFFTYLGTELADSELEQLLTIAKAELDESADADGIVKIELNDTNRPDLWSTAGLARQLRVYREATVPSYTFFSHPDHTADSAERRVVVDPGLAEIRPYIAAFAVEGAPIDEALLNDVIQTQEKLCWNYGRKRSSIAMGVYRTDLISYPVRYLAADPDATGFVPLGATTRMSMRRMLSEHQKGLEFGSIVADFERFPLLTDDNGDVLSFPPIINSDRIGAVEEGDAKLFIEMTGTDMPSLLTACAIVACDFSDAGYTVLPVTVEYPYDTPVGRHVTTPFYFQRPASTTVEYVARLLGRSIEPQELIDGLRRMGIAAEHADGTLTVRPPEYRNDFLHAVDIVEDAMIGIGMDSFAPEVPSDFTVGRLLPSELYARRVTSQLIGLGYQEMIFNYLGSRRDFVERMYPRDQWQRACAEHVQVDNPMSENFEFVRRSILPHLLIAESVSANAVYPHYIFEVGKIVRRDPHDNYGSLTRDSVGMLCADVEAGFSLMSSHISVLFYYLGLQYSLREVSDGRFIQGRAAEIVISSRAVGRFGEIHPEVLEKFGIQMPCAACEIDLDSVMEL